jgi:hypothetical protein
MKLIIVSINEREKIRAKSNLISSILCKSRRELRDVVFVRSYKAKIDNKTALTSTMRPELYII